MYKQYTRMGVKSTFLDGSFQTLLVVSYAIVRIHEVPFCFFVAKLGHHDEMMSSLPTLGRSRWFRNVERRRRRSVGRAFESSRVASRRVASSRVESRACGSDSWSRC